MTSTGTDGEQEALLKMDTILLKDAERVVRITMIVILLTAGTSKFFSHGGFFAYYSTLFQGDLRIALPQILVDSYLRLIPFIEIGLGLALLTNRFKHYVVYGWFGFFLSLLVGHYILQEWSSVNQILDYLFLGILCLLLPAHRSWLHRDKRNSDLLSSRTELVKQDSSLESRGNRPCT